MPKETCVHPEWHISNAVTVFDVELSDLRPCKEHKGMNCSFWHACLNFGF